MPKLQVLNGKRQGEVFDLQPNLEMVVGHRQSAAISIDDPWVSWDHARLIYQADTASCWIEDLGSTNGTYVNCVRVKREQLRHEDIVFLGKTHVIYLAPVEGDLFGVPSSTLSQEGAPATAGPFPSSSTGPSFGSSGDLPPLLGVEDPFASRSSKNTQAPLFEPKESARDPFSDSSVDPFSSGPDYSAPPGAGAAMLPGAKNSPFAETRGDDLLGLNARERPAAGSSRSLSLSGLDEDNEMAVPGPSSHEISRLIDGGRGGSDLFGDLAELEPLPPPESAGGAVAQETTLPVSGAALGLDGKAPSEMRTQPINTEAVNQLLEEHRRRTERYEGGPRGVQAGTHPGTRVDGPAAPPAAPPPTPAAFPDPGGAAPDPGGAAPDPGGEAFDRAKMQDEVRRLQLALQAAKQQNPQAVAAAARELRDQELGRLAHQVAELQREAAELRAQLAARESELNLVTDEMIEKEDLIDQLRDQLSSGGSSASVGSFSAPPPPPPLARPDGQDYSSLEF
jgi:hypothetical protein